MNALTPLPVPAQMTLANVLDRLQEHPDLTETRRRDLCSAVNSAARLLHRSPADLAADMDTLRDLLSVLHPIQAGISKNRLANIKSDLAAAIRETRNRRRRVVVSKEPTEAWRALRVSLRTQWQRHTLSRLARYCSEIGVEPHQVTDAVLDRFHAHLSDTQLAKDPADVLKVTRQTWNGLIENDGLDLPPVSKPKLERFITRPISDYPASFAADIEAWIGRMSDHSELEQDGPVDPLRPTSLRNIRASIRQFAHAVVESGVPTSGITSLARLVEFETYKAGRRTILARNGGERTAGLGQITAHLIAIAKHHVGLDERTVDKLRPAKRRDDKRVGMTAKNRERLGQFDDEANIDRLLLLPSNVVREAKAVRKPSSRDAVRVLHAVAIDILLACPMRSSNLANLDMKQHLHWTGAGHNETLTLRISGSQTKTGRQIEAPMPAETAALIKAYIRDFRPLLRSAAGTALFPQSDGTPRLPGHMSESMKALIARELGITVNAHLFRHFAGKLYLDERPDDYEAVRRMLSHSKLETTTRFYASLEDVRAFKRYDEMVLKPRKERSSGYAANLGKVTPSRAVATKTGGL